MAPWWVVRDSEVLGDRRRLMIDRYIGYEKTNVKKRKGSIGGEVLVPTDMMSVPR